MKPRLLIAGSPITSPPDTTTETMNRPSAASWRLSCITVLAFSSSMPSPSMRREPEGTLSPRRIVSEVSMTQLPMSGRKMLLSFMPSSSASSACSLR